jgi:hypothetical protein
MMWTPSLPDSRSWTLRSRHLDVRRAAMPGHFPHHGGCWNRRARRHQIRAVLSMAERHPEANRQETDRQSQRRHPAVIFNANQFKRISRPRCVESPSAGKNTVAAVFGHNLAWKKHFGTHRLVCPQPTSEAHIPNGWSSPKCWLAGEHLPCFTTPAPTEAGRAGSRFTKSWIPQYRAGGWQYAPWHYHETVLMADPSHQLRKPPIETKETLHHIPVGYTSSINSVTQL